VEDTLHMIWTCPKSGKVWDWVSKLMQFASEAPDLRLSIAFQHVILAEKLEESNGISKELWVVLRAATCWVLWTHRCKHFMQDTRTTTTVLIQMVWHRLCTYLRKAWEVKMVKVRRKSLDIAQAHEDMVKKFGNNVDIWAIHEIQLVVPPVPPRPP
jgi:hypothetical protein